MEKYYSSEKEFGRERIGDVYVLVAISNNRILNLDKIIEDLTDQIEKI